MIVSKKYKHIYCKDVAFYPISSYNLSWHKIEYAGWWINIAHKREFLLELDTILVEKNDLHKWKEYRHGD